MSAGTLADTVQQGDTGSESVFVLVVPAVAESSEGRCTLVPGAGVCVGVCM